jgi:hypothetical protein
MARNEETKMPKFRGWCVRFLAFALAAGMCFAQDAVPAKFYKLDFVVREVEGTKVLNTRTYSITTSTESKAPCEIRAGSKVPYTLGPAPIGGQPQFSYLDVGVAIDCSAVTVEPGQLSLHVEVNISSLAAESPTLNPPVVRDNKWGSAVFVPLKKPTVIFSSDDLTSKHQMQLELTATPIP